ADRPYPHGPPSPPGTATSPWTRPRSNPCRQACPGSPSRKPAGPSSCRDGPSVILVVVVPIEIARHFGRPQKLVDLREIVEARIKPEAEFGHVFHLTQRMEIGRAHV